eukprot:CAMPEP_0201690808 /NCGR_PEP_ID=MMETSP0578-20130828/4136_1 /ASSEMBLY_ACC=CAM_ASM_000663 /TAXON_ID=267565 /ORGANISM="Skeletonema grethea, Strain CCMP 1804" /LENGTH=55 /DNA_ID=CAMNT_0048175871 /DNA_START=73 /DNA_END=240 /DNA_ORIENTATION=-
MADDFNDVRVPFECTSTNESDVDHGDVSCIARNIFLTGVSEPHDHDIITAHGCHD